MTEPEANVLPIYFVADESISMKDLVPDLNKGLTSLLDAIQAKTTVWPKIRFCVMGFSDDTRIHLPLSNFEDLERMPTLQAGGSTSYRSAFETLLCQIQADVVKLKKQNNIVNRPAVFFLSDGRPNDNDGWEEALAALKDHNFGAHPNIIAFGLGEADADIIAKVASQEGYAFLSAEGIDTGKAIVEFCKALTKSVIQSGQALARGNAELQVKEPEGFMRISADPV